MGAPAGARQPSRPEAPEAPSPARPSATSAGTDVVPAPPERAAAPSAPGASGDGGPEAPATAAQARATPEPVAPAASTPSPAREVTAPTATSRPLARGRELAALFNRGQLGRVWAAFSPSVRAKWGSVSALGQYRAAGLDSYGPEANLLNESVVQQGGVTYYTRTATFERQPSEAWTLTIGLDENGRVQDFGIVAADLPTGP